MAPERSPIYSTDNDDGIVILNEKLTRIKSDYSNVDIILAGDLNARTQDFLDFIPQDDLDYIFGDTDYPGDTFDLDRKSKDTDTYNNFGLSLIDLCCEHDIHMLNGRMFDDVDGNITCTSNEGRSLVDYIIASTNLFDKCSYFVVDTQDFSDHFPVTCTLTLQQSLNDEFSNATDDNDETFRWHKYIEDICFFEVNTKYISSSELKTSEFSRVRSTSENFYVFNSRDEIYLVFTEKKQIFFLFYTIRRHFPTHKAGGENAKNKNF